MQGKPCALPTDDTALAMRAGAPFVCLNTLVGGLAAYGLAGLRAEPWAVAQFALMLVLQSLVAIQVMVLSVYITPNQARPRARRVQNPR